jgi:hypothetical protein
LICLSIEDLRKTTIHLKQGYDINDKRGILLKLFERKPNAMKDKLIIEKQKELIKKLNRFTEYQHDSIVNGEDADYEEVFDHILGKIKQLESELTALEAEPEAKKSS